MKQKAGIICTLLIIIFSTGTSAQHRLDTLRLDSIRILPKSKFFSKLIRKGIDAITVHPQDTNNQLKAMNVKSEDVFRKYDGRVIRNIEVKQLAFQQTVTDTTKKLASIGANILNNLHTTTKEWVIRDNLFIRKGRRVNAYQLADNERYLRTLDFIQDARIVVRPVGEDSVDIEVISKDFFTITGGIDAGSLKKVKANAADANLLGMGQRIQLTTLYDQDRDPILGWELLYRKNSIGGSFVNGTVGYTKINYSAYDGRQEEQAYFLQLDRPLVSPYSLFAGGLTFAYKESFNLYRKVRPDSFFYRYENNVLDVWAGINLASKQLLASTDIRDRRFLSLRYAQNMFAQIPYQVADRFDPTFNDMQLALAQLTFFRQDFYKTNYVYGFGVTEDIPYGYNISLIAGWYRQLDLKRPYTGINIDNHIISKRGGIFRYILRAGAFYNYLQLEDAGILLGGSMYSPLIELKRRKFRQYVGFSYARIFNTVIHEPLRIDNPFGLRDFGSRFPNGAERLNFVSETTAFLNRKFLGFHFAPFVTGSAVLITPEHQKIAKSDIYPGIGGGIRIRNENLVFGTVELRSIFYPRTTAGAASYRVLLFSNIRYRYNSNYINKPEFVRLNVDDY